MNTNNNLVVLLVIAISILMVTTGSAAQPEPEPDQCTKVNERCFSDNECCEGYNCGLETVKVDYSKCQNCNTRGHP